MFEVSKVFVGPLCSKRLICGVCGSRAMVSFKYTEMNVVSFQWFANEDEATLRKI